MKKMSQAKMDRMVSEFNDRCPVGSAVVVTKDDGSEVNTTVRYPASILSGHTPVAWLVGISGCYLLTRVREAKK